MSGVKRIADFSDAEIVAAVNGGTIAGGRCTHILRRLVGNYAKPDPRLGYLYRRLIKLEALGMVRRCRHSSYVNSIYWTAPFAVGGAA